MPGIEREELAVIAVEAGRLALSLRDEGASVRFKDDGTPQSEADRRADALIRKRLFERSPEIPVVAEESGVGEGAVEAGRFFLVDPLDGTKDFLAGRDEFTVNIALIAQGRPIAGVVLAPALGELFIAGADGAWMRRLNPRDLSPAGEERRLRVSQPAGAIRAVASRLHADRKTEALLARLPAAERLGFGSSLKFCRIAEGRAEIYPRLASIMEWDTAAGQALVEAAGGTVVDLTGAPLLYGKADLGWRSKPFIASVSRTLAEKAVLIASEL